MKKIILIAASFLVCFTAFAKQISGRKNVNSIPVNSIQNGEYIYTANLVSKSEKDISMFIDVFKNGKFIDSFCITKEGYENDDIYETFLTDGRDVLFAVEDSETTGFAFIHSFRNPETRKKEKRVSFYKIKKDKVLYVSSIDLNECEATSGELRWGKFTYSKANKKYYFSACVGMDIGKYNHDIFLMELDENFNFVDSKRLYTEKWDKAESLFCIGEKLYVLCDFGKLDFEYKYVFVIDENLNIEKTYKIENFKDRIFCDGNSIYAVSVCGIDRNGINIKCFDKDFNEMWSISKKIYENPDKPEVYEFHDLGDKIGFSYIKLNDYSDRKTNYVICNKDGSNVHFYKSDFVVNTDFYQVLDKLFIFGKNAFSRYNEKEVYVISHASYTALTGTEEMEEFFPEDFENEKLPAVKKPENLSPEAEIAFNKIFKDRLEEKVIKTKVITAKKVQIDVNAESYECKNKIFDNDAKKVAVEYSEINPFDEEFMKSIPSYEMSER